MKTYRYMIGMLLCVWLLAACDNSNAFDEYAKFDTTAQTAWGQSIVDGSNGYVAHVKCDRTYNLADGVDVLEMAFLADDGLAMQLFLFKIALSDKITLRTTLADEPDLCVAHGLSALIDDPDRYENIDLVSGSRSDMLRDE